jgi:hypothetical protein
LDAARAVLAHFKWAGIKEDVVGPFFRPLPLDELALVPQPLDRKMP